VKTFEDTLWNDTRTYGRRTDTQTDVRSLHRMTAKAALA